MAAVNFSKTGNLNQNDGTQWLVRQNTPDIPSPLLIKDTVYFVGRNSGMLSSVDAKSGKIKMDVKRFNALRSVYSSPVSADGKIFVTGRGGTTLVVSADGEVISTNKLDEPVDATLALVGNQIFIRSKNSLYCIGKD